MTPPPKPSFARRDVDRRVPESQAQARQGLLLCLLFAVAAGLVLVSGGDRWVALHLFAAGALVSAFGGVSVMLASTWSAAPAPVPALGLAQRLAVAVGAAGVVLARSRGAGAAVLGAFGTLYVIGLLALAVLLVDTVAHGSKRRFDPAVTGWAAGLVIAALGSVAGIVFGSGAGPTGLRQVHLTTNLLGFLGVVIATTIPFFGSTVVRSKMNPAATPAAVHLAIGLLGGGALVGVIGLAADNGSITAAGLGLHGLGVLDVYRISPRPTRRQLDWAGPRLVGLWLGGFWWTVAVAASAIGALGGSVGLSGRWLPVLLIGGYAQILWASLAYLLPMLRGGGHELLGAGFARTRSPLTLIGFQAAAVGALLESGTIVRIAVAVVVLDTAWRVVTVGAGRPAD